MHSSTVKFHIMFLHDYHGKDPRFKAVIKLTDVTYGFGSIVYNSLDRITAKIEEAYQPASNPNLKLKFL